MYSLYPTETRKYFSKNSKKVIKYTADSKIDRFAV